MIKEKNNHRITQITRMPFRLRKEKNPFNPLNPMIKGLRAQREETSADNITLRQFINDKEKNNYQITQITQMPFRQREEKKSVQSAQSDDKRSSSVARRNIR